MMMGGKVSRVEMALAQVGQMWQCEIEYSCSALCQLSAAIRKTTCLRGSIAL